MSYYILHTTYYVEHTWQPDKGFHSPEDSSVANRVIMLAHHDRGAMLFVSEVFQKALTGGLGIQPCQHAV
jgi:hypothetical protein